MSDLLTPVDWHVHAHSPGDIGAVLDSAAAAFARVNPRPQGVLGVLMLAEMPGASAFARLATPGGEPPGWSVDATSEDVSVVASRGADRIAVVSGFQVTTAERLEVLALGTRVRPQDGLPAERVLAQVAALGAMAVLPWGVGKWLGARGAAVAALLGRLPPRSFFLGDNAARPVFWPAPAVFREAAEKGIAVLPGTDTLPGARPAAGAFGSLVPGPIPADRPMEALRRRLAEPAAGLLRYGSLASPLGFLRDQAMLRLRRLGRGR